MNTRFSKVLVSVVLIAVLVLPALAFIPSARAQEGPLVVIWVWDPTEVYEVPAGSTILLATGWFVCRAPGLYTSFQNAFAVELTVDGQVLLDGSVRATKPYWRPRINTGWTYDFCNNHSGDEYGNYWVYDLSWLGVGEHTVEWTTAQTHPLTDMLDGDGDGKPDMYPAGVLDQMSVTITVTAE